MSDTWYVTHSLIPKMLDMLGGYERSLRFPAWNALTFKYGGMASIEKADAGIAGWIISFLKGSGVIFLSKLPG